MNNKNCCMPENGNYEAISKSFFRQFDPNNDYGDCDLFSKMKTDFALMCETKNTKEQVCIDNSCDNDVEVFFENYSSIDKYLKCHLADDMKKEMKELCRNFNDYYAVLQLTQSV